MMRMTLALVAVASLAACGGGSRYSSANAVSYSTAGQYIPQAIPFASGPIERACQADGRRGATAARCGCVQAVADQSLSRADQRRGAGYFSDPHRLQEVRQSDNAGDERFWLAWKAFGQNAAALCAKT